MKLDDEELISYWLTLWLNIDPLLSKKDKLDIIIELLNN